jgi:uncharacterized membrane protein
MSLSFDPEAPADPPASPSRRWRVRPRELAVWLRGAAVLAVIGFSFAAFVIQMTRTFRGNAWANLRLLVNQNQVPTRTRTFMLLGLAGGVAAGGLAALVLYLWRRRQEQPAARAARVLRTARLLSPLFLLGLVRPLLLATEWDAFPRIVAVTFFALLSEVCVRAATGEILGARLGLARLLARLARATSALFGRVRRVVRPETLVLALGVLGYAVWMSYGTILIHRHFGTMAFDLGNYDGMFFNMLHGHPFRCPSVLPKGGSWSMLSNHAELSMFALVPLYALHPSAETLLVLQSAALASGAIPLYRFAARRLPRPAALVLALAYLLFPPMHQANFYDIHFQPFAVAFTLWAIDMLDVRRPVLFAIFFALALGCREDVPIGFAVLGLYLLLVGKRTRAAVAMTVVAIAYFVVIKFLVMPHFGSWWFSDLYKDLYPAGENSYGGVVKTLLSNPVFAVKTLITTDKIVLFLLVLAPLAFLPLRGGLVWMSLLPAAPFTVLTTGYGPTVQISFQYVLLFVPFLFPAAAIALERFGPSAQGRARLAGALGAIAVATFFTTRIWGAMPPGDKFRGGFHDIPELRPLSAAEKQKARDLAELAALIPKKASVSVSDYEHPHVSTRMDAFALRNGYEGADYILFSEDADPGGGRDNGHRALSTGEFEILQQRPGSRLLLLRRKHQ